MKRVFLFIFFIIIHCSIFSEQVFKDIVVGRVFEIDNDGYIFTSYGQHSISKYSPDGRLVLRFGQKGEGPGDIKRLGWFAINPIDNAIYVTEFINGNKWISKFSKQGKYLGEWKCQLDWLKYDGLSIIKFDIKGNVYIETVKFHHQRFKEYTLESSEKQLLRFSPKGEILNTIYTFKGDFAASKGGKGNVTIPFHNYLFWTIFRQKVVVRENWADHLKILDSTGKLEKSIPLPFKRDKLNNRDFDKWEEWMKSIRWVKNGIAEGWFDLKYWRKRLPFPKFKPISGGLMFVDSQGKLYSQKYSGYESSDDGWAQIDLADNTIEMKHFQPNERLLCIWKNYFFLRRQSDDSEKVVIKINEKKVFSR